MREQLDKSELNFANKNKEWQQVDYEKKAYEINFKQLQEKFRKQAMEMDQTRENLRELTNENKMLEKTNKEVSLLNTQLANQKDMMAREKLEAVNEKNLTKQGVSALTREIEYLRKQVEAEKANIVNLIRDRDMMKKSILKADEENMNNKEELIKQINEYKKLKDDMDRNK